MPCAIYILGSWCLFLLFCLTFRITSLLMIHLQCLFQFFLSQLVDEVLQWLLCFLHPVLAIPAGSSKTFNPIPAFIREAGYVLSVYLFLCRCVVLLGGGHLNSVPCFATVHAPNITEYQLYIRFLEWLSQGTTIWGGGQTRERFLVSQFWR